MVGVRGAKRPRFPKICHTYPTIMKLCTVIPYLKKIQKFMNTSQTPSVLLTSAFFHRNSANLLYQEIQTQIAFSYIISNSFNFF